MSKLQEREQAHLGIRLRLVSEPDISSANTYVYVSGTSDAGSDAKKVVGPPVGVKTLPSGAFGLSYLLVTQFAHGRW